MFDVAPTELLILGVVAIAVIPPKDLPRAMRTAGHWIGKVRGVARQFRSGFDEIIRESEIHEMEKKWRAENERIMREHPASSLLNADPHLSGEPASAAPAVSSYADDYREVAPVPPIAHTGDGANSSGDLTPRPALTDHTDQPTSTVAELPPLDRST